MSAWTTIRNDLMPWQWIKHGGNREDWMRRLAEAALIGTGAGAAGLGPMAGLFGSGASSAAATGYGLGGSAGEAAAAGGMSAAPSAWSTAAGYGGKAMKGLSMANQAMQLAGGIMNPAPQQKPPMAPPPQPAPPMPVAPLYSGADTPPPGVDPNQWASMTPEQKKALMAQRGMA